MSSMIQTKTNFTAGEVSRDLLGRGDLNVYDNGAAALRNIFVHPTGGLTRRAGLRYLDTVPGGGRLVAFTFNTEQVYLLVVTGGRVDVYMDGAKISGFAAPWTVSQLATLNWTQSADTLLVVHPDVVPQRITRSSHTDWTISDWTYETRNGQETMPWARFSQTVTMRHNNATSLRTTGPYFLPGHVGTSIRFQDWIVPIVEYIDATLVRVEPPEAMPINVPTYDYSEPAFSALRGYPRSVTFHQGRLVVGGTRDLPNRVWMSRIGSFFDFAPGTGLDDEGIDLALMSDQVNAIQHVVSGPHLQVFTSGAEWTVSGEPLTPSTVQVRRQTQVGSPADRSVPPRPVEGATLFVSASGRELREFLFSEAEQSYQSADLAMLARHVMSGPQDMDYDPVRRLVHLVMGNGVLATVTNFRREQVTAWSVQETDGAFRAVCVVGGETYVLVARAGGVFLEVFDDTLHTDSGLTGASATSRTLWSGLGHLNGQTVQVLADWAEVTPAEVTGGAVVLVDAATDVEIGLPFTHIVEPLPPLPEGPRGGGNGRQVRLVRASFRLLDTPVLKVDTGRGAATVSFKRFGAAGVLDAPPPPFTGDATVRAIGWLRDAARPLWRIEQDTPMPFTLLSVTTETKVTD